MMFWIATITLSKGQKQKTPTISDKGLLYWWPLCESNTAPTDSGLCGFHHSLDYAFTMARALGGCRLVSTRSWYFY